MSDLISRQAAIRKLQDKGEEPRYQHTDEDWKCGLFMAEDIINDLPTAEVTLCHLDSPCEYQNADIAIPSAQRKKGEWILSDLQDENEVANDNYYYVCSCCGKGDIHAKSAEVPFCWWCGARMKGEEDGTDKP